VVHSGFWRIGQILPPLLILPLAITPLDFPLAFLWIIGWLACAARANEFGRKAAQEIQRRCHAEQVCPASILDWSPCSDAFVSETFAGAWVKYRVLYSVSGDRKQFSVLVRHDLDKGLLFIGGVDKELHESSKGP
jgi:hypothetical protein